MSRGPPEPSAVGPSSGLPLDLPLPEPGAAGRRGPSWRYLLVLLLPALMFTGAVVGMYFQPALLRSFYAYTGLQPGGGSTEPIAIPPEIDLPPQMAETLLPSDVVGLARILPRGDISVVAPPYGAGDARVAEILVSVGDQVERGQTLALLDNRAALESAVLTAEANLAVRQATLAQTRATVVASRDEAQAALEQAQANAAEVASQFQRAEELFQRGVTTQSALDLARTASEEGHQAVTRAEATLRRFAALALDEQPDVVVAARNVEAAEAELARARLDVERSAVVAPINGTILDMHVTPGEKPPPTGMMEMGDIDRMTARVEIWQDRIAAVQLGQPVELVTPAMARTLQGRVESIGLTVGRQGLISDDAAENKDARVVRVTVLLDEESSRAVARLSNLEAVARIDTSAPATAPAPAP